MQMSLPGLLVVVAILVVAYYSRGMLIIGLVASQAFGATAVVTLTFLGGSSPLIYTIFAACSSWPSLRDVASGSTLEACSEASARSGLRFSRRPTTKGACRRQEKSLWWPSSATRMGRITATRRMLSGTERRWLHHPADSGIYWVGEAMVDVNHVDLPKTPEKVSAAGEASRHEEIARGLAGSKQTGN
jgi:hypothetical protein